MWTVQSFYNGNGFLILIQAILKVWQQNNLSIIHSALVVNQEPYTQFLFLVIKIY